MVITRYDVTIAHCSKHSVDYFSIYHPYVGVTFYCLFIKVFINLSLSIANFKEATAKTLPENMNN